MSGRIHLLGHTDPISVFWASDVAVLASEREGFGITIVEAMACGLPAVRTPVEGAVDQIDPGVNGDLFDVGDYDALASKLEAIASDRDLRQRMSKAARDKALRSFSDQAMARRTIDVYNELAN